MLVAARGHAYFRYTSLHALGIGTPPPAHYNLLASVAYQMPALVFCPMAKVKTTLGYTFVARLMPRRYLLHGQAENNPRIYLCGLADAGPRSLLNGRDENKASVA